MSDNPYALLLIIKKRVNMEKFVEYVINDTDYCDYFHYAYSHCLDMEYILTDYEFKFLKNFTRLWYGN